MASFLAHLNPRFSWPLLVGTCSPAIDFPGDMTTKRSVRSPEPNWQEWSHCSPPTTRNDRVGILYDNERKRDRKDYGSFGASWAQRNPTFGSCSVGSPFVRKEDRRR